MLEPLAELHRLRDRLSKLPPRSLAVYRKRRLIRPRITLELIGSEYRVTRERVRQIEGQVERQLQRLRMMWRLGPGLRRLTEAVELLGGTSTTSAEISIGQPSSDEALLFAAYFELTQRSTDGRWIGDQRDWTAFDETLATIKEVRTGSLPTIRRMLEQHLPDISSTELAELLSSKGISPGGARDRGTSNADRILKAFQETGRPMKKSDLISATGLTTRQVDSVISRKESFGWVGLSVFAPASWGLEPYYGTEQAIEDEIMRRGGAAAMGDVIDSVIRRFGCTYSSCVIYISSSPRLERRGDIVRVRDPSTFTLTEGRPERQRRVYDDLRGGFVWGIDVDSDVLRGSSQPVPTSIASRLGVGPNRDVELELPGGIVPIRYSGNVIFSGSLRQTVKAVDANEGDRLLVRVRTNGGWSFDLARRRSQDATTALRFVGSPTEDQDPLALLALACWEDDPSLLRETLWDRREEALLDLLQLPLNDPRGNTAKLEQIDLLLGPAKPSRRDLAIAAGLGPQGLAPDGGIGLARLSSVQATRLTRYLTSSGNWAQRDVEFAVFGASLDETARLGAPRDGRTPSLGRPTGRVE